MCQKAQSLGFSYLLLGINTLLLNNNVQLDFIQALHPKHPEYLNLVIYNILKLVS